MFLRNWFNFYSSPRQKRITLTLFDAPLFLVVGLPNGVAFHANIQIFHVFVVVSHIDDFWALHLIHVRLTRNIRASHIINTRQGRIEFRVSVNDVVESLFAFLQLGVENTYTIFPYIVVDEFAVSTIVRETVPVFLRNADIEHIMTIIAEFHCSYSVYGVLRQIVYAGFFFQFLSWRTPIHVK
jgi:hypothetical protein